jgi:flagellar L-ring protein precursor FlgH
MVRIFYVGLGLLLLAGCAGMPLRDPEYASTRPPVQPVPQANNGAIYQAGYAIPLFEDLKARRVGDVLTIRLVERTNASKKASTTIDKKTDISVANPTLFGKPVSLPGGRTLETGLSSDNEFEGSGDSSQSNSLSGEITVTVAEVLPNGNLLVRGEKLLTLNQGDEHVQISGVVRPIDIGPDNVVLSPRVADVQIAYAGRGAVADANIMGWLARFFISALWPF